MPEQNFITHFPYEYVSGVGRMTFGVETYLVNRGGSEALGRVLIVEAVGGDVPAVLPYAVRFDSGNQVVPPGEWAFSQFEGSDGAEPGLYFGRFFATTKDLVPSMTFYRQSNEPTGTVPDFAYAPGDFAVFSPSFEPLWERPIPPKVAE